MSSILKALKKLEHEKSCHVPDSLKIDSDILKTADSSRSFSPLAFVLLILFVFGGGAAGAIFFLKVTRVPQETAGAEPVITPTTRMPVTPSYDGIPAATVVNQARREPSGETAQKQPQKISVSGEEAAGTVKSPDRPATVSGLNESADAVLSGPPLNTIPALKVDGIAYQVSGAENMAIVNGTAVTNGSIIEGMTVMDVQRDRVLFQHNGEKFEILLGQSNR